eukprot:7441941-Pyramimonas_sp.AAC.1
MHQTFGAHPQDEVDQIVKTTRTYRLELLRRRRTIRERLCDECDDKENDLVHTELREVTTALTTAREIT